MAAAWRSLRLGEQAQSRGATSFIRFVPGGVGSRAGVPWTPTPSIADVVQRLVMSGGRGFPQGWVRGRIAALTSSSRKFMTGWLQLRDNSRTGWR